MGYKHPDDLKEDLTIGQYEDWCQFHAQFHLNLDRDDIHWGISIADFRNANKSEGEMPERPIDVMPYADPFEDDMSVEDLRDRIGIGRLLNPPEET